MWTGDRIRAMMLSRREAIGLLGAGAGGGLATLHGLGLGAQAPGFPSGAIIRTLLRDVPPDALIARERAAHLWAAIDRLPDKLRMVIVLAGIEEHDTAEVARLLDVPQGTVKSRLFLARQRLKEQLQWTQ